MVCKKRWPPEFFTKNGLLNAQKRGDRLVCRTCRQTEQEEKKREQFQCCKQHPAGRADFNPKKLRNSSFRGGRLICDTCDARERDLKARLRRKDAWRCTCRKIPHGQKANACLHDRRHAEKCQLYPMAPGEERWDGKNLVDEPVTKNDIEFLALDNAW